MREDTISGQHDSAEESNNDIFKFGRRNRLSLESQEHAASQRRDWVSLLAPTLLAVVVTLAIQVGGYIWFMATLQTRVNNVELRVKVGEDTLTRLPQDYIPRVEHVRADQIRQEQRVEDQRRLDRLEGKIDLLLERK